MSNPKKPAKSSQTIQFNTARGLDGKKSEQGKSMSAWLRNRARREIPDADAIATPSGSRVA